MAEIPTELWRQIGSAPTFRSSENQWGEHGFVLVDGVVHEYAIDRKAQYDRLIESRPLDEFLRRCGDEAVRAWAREHGGQNRDQDQDQDRGS